MLTRDINCLPTYLGGLVRAPCPPQGKGSYRKGALTEINVSGISGRFKRRVTERGVFAFACQYTVSPHCQTGNHTVTQMQHPFLLVEGRPNCARQGTCQYIVGACGRCDIVLSSRSPRVGWGIPQVRSSRASKGGEHPRLVLGQRLISRNQRLTATNRPPNL